jgi:hypothetical protein
MPRGDQKMRNFAMSNSIETPMRHHMMIASCNAIIVIGLAYSGVGKSRQFLFHQGFLQQAHAIMF